MTVIIGLYAEQLAFWDPLASPVACSPLPALVLKLTFLPLLGERFLAAWTISFISWLVGSLAGGIRFPKLDYGQIGLSPPVFGCYLPA